MRGLSPLILLLSVPIVAAAQAPAAATRRIEPPPGASQPSGRRVALVVGNEAYSSSPLTNPVQDARRVAAALRDLSFEVAEAENLNLKNFELAARAFTEGLRKGDVALFYYSGHGMQIGEENYLVPVDYSAVNETEARFGSFPAARLQDAMSAAGVSLSVLILDACRDNPYRRSKGGPAAGRPCSPAPAA